jgi:S-adenosylmethionine hydrolase
MPIALLTDFGTGDYYVGAMKGVIICINSDALVLDITHDIEPQNIASAAFVLEACYRDFPPETVFLCVVDPGVGSDRRAVIVSSNDQYFVGPDNGIFSFLLGSENIVHNVVNNEFFRHPVSSTFHGRDIFAPVAAHLSNDVQPSEFGPRITDAIKLPAIMPTRSADSIVGQVIHVDRFGNLITNIPPEAIDCDFRLDIGGVTVTDRYEFYAAAAPSQPFVIVGSAGFIEVSINGASAAELLNSKAGTPVNIKRI